MKEAKTKNYKKTLLACYFGLITQAIVVNFAPLLFITFRNVYGVSLAKLALIPTVLFFSQILVDIFCAKFVDKIGYRKSVVASEFFAAGGLISLAFLPDLLKSFNPFAGIIASVILYAIGSGLSEVLCSPIIQACPFENKESAMSLLHSFYCWGSVGVILISAALFSIIGVQNWKIVACLWAFVPLYNVYNFLTCPIEHFSENGKELSVKNLFKTPLFWFAAVLMICSGASELAMSQWASAFAESGLGLSKTASDIAGPCLFAVTMGISRAIFGKFSGKINLQNFMIGSAVLCLCCYVVSSLSRNSAFALLGCAFCGFSVGIMWPGTLSVSSKKIPKGGTAMFALLAMAGDLDGSLGPGVVGIISQKAGDNLQTGLLFGGVFPLILIIFLIAVKFKKE